MFPTARYFGARANFQTFASMEVSNMWKCLWQVFHFYQMSSQKNIKNVYSSNTFLNSKRKSFTSLVWVFISRSKLTATIILRSSLAVQVQGPTQRTSSISDHSREAALTYFKDKKKLKLFVGHTMYYYVTYTCLIILHHYQPKKHLKLLHLLLCFCWRKQTA